MGLFVFFATHLRYSTSMNLTESQKKLLLQLQWASLPIVKEKEREEDLCVLRRYGLISRGDEIFSTWHASDYGTSVLEAMEMSGKL